LPRLPRSFLHLHHSATTRDALERHLLSAVATGSSSRIHGARGIDGDTQRWTPATAPGVRPRGLTMPIASLPAAQGGEFTPLGPAAAASFVLFAPIAVPWAAPFVLRRCWIPGGACQALRHSCALVVIAREGAMAPSCARWRHRSSSRAAWRGSWSRRRAAVGCADCASGGLQLARGGSASRGAIHELTKPPRHITSRPCPLTPPAS